MLNPDVAAPAGRVPGGDRVHAAGAEGRRSRVVPFASLQDGQEENQSMTSHESVPSPDEAGPPAPEPAPVPVPVPPADVTPLGGPRGGRGPSAGLWSAALVAALVAAFSSWGAGEATYRTYQPSEAAAAQSYRFKELNEQTAIANARNGAIVFGTLGGLLGLALGLAGGLSRLSVPGALAGAAAGLVLGAAAGALPAFGIMPWQWMHRHDDPTSTTLVPILIHVGLWCGLGAAAGLAFGLGRVGPKAAALVVGAFGGLAGALAGTVVHELVAALAFPMDRTDEPFAPTALTRLLPHLCVALFTAAGAVLTAGSLDRTGRKPLAGPADLA
jgi:hypothetical protein